MPLPDLEWSKNEISALVSDVASLEFGLTKMGVNAIDECDYLEALDIIRRIERKMIADMPVPKIR